MFARFLLQMTKKKYCGVSISNYTTDSRQHFLSIMRLLHTYVNLYAMTYSHLIHTTTGFVRLFVVHCVTIDIHGVYIHSTIHTTKSVEEALRVCISRTVFTITVSSLPHNIFILCVAREK